MSLATAMDYLWEVLIPNQLVLKSIVFCTMTYEIFLKLNPSALTLWVFTSKFLCRKVFIWVWWFCSGIKKDNSDQYRCTAGSEKTVGGNIKMAASWRKLVIIQDQSYCDKNYTSLDNVKLMLAILLSRRYCSSFYL